VHEPNSALVEKELLEISKQKGWVEMGATERERILRHSQSDAPFSSMVAAYLSKLGIKREA
jgi:hypothetical protein